MTRPNYFFLLISLAFLYSPLAGLSKFERSALEKQEIAKNIVWFNHEPLAFPLRRGNLSEDWTEIYERQHTPENIALMAKIGARYGRLHFYKGFGLAYEMPEIRKSAEASRIMHSHGMLVSLYVGGTMFIETFYRETPEAVSWEQRDQYDRPVPYLVDTQTFRHHPCPNEPAYRNYIKKVLKVGIDSVGANQFFFDNYMLRPEPKSCRCPRCQTAFKEFLKRKYPSEKEAYARFGYPSVDYLKVNEWDTFNRPEDLTAINDPVLQEWIRFRCESMADQCREFYDYIKSVNPAVSVGFNLKGLYSLNRIWENAIYHPLYSGHCDYYCFDIDGMKVGLDRTTGAVVSEVRSYKIGRLLDMSCSEAAPGIELAEQMAFNYQKYLPGFGYHSTGYNHYAERDLSPLAEFFRFYNDRYYTETANVADCAILRTWPSMAYSISATSIPTILVEQVLFQHKIPFDIIFDENIETISRYQAVILPGQESLSQKIIDRLENFVESGGTLIFTGNTADYTDWRRTRTVNPLLSFLGFKTRPEVTTVRKVGKGILVYIPEIVPAVKIEPAGGWAFPSSQWVLPKNHEEIAQTIVRHLTHGPSLVTEAPLTTAAELLNREKSKETIIHFVNYDDRKTQSPFRVELKKQRKGKVNSVAFFSPELDEPLRIEFTEEGGKIIFTVPQMKLYSMVVVSYES